MIEKNRNEIIQRIDNVLTNVLGFLNEAQYRPVYSVPIQSAYGELTFGENQQLGARLKQTILDVTPAFTEYHEFARLLKPAYKSSDVAALHGILKSVREDYANNYLQGINQLIDSELFSDILEQAEHLLSQGYARASIVVAGVSLESHLRKLAERNSITITDDEKYVKAESLNTELYKKQIYDKTLHKSITSWLGLRNDAAHPDPKEINEGLIEPMIMGIRNLIEKYPA